MEDLRRDAAAVADLEPVAVDGCEVRTHGTTLYNSIYRANDNMIVNAHVWGVNAYGAPMWHFRRQPEVEPSMFHAYAESFDGVWATGVRLEG